MLINPDKRCDADSRGLKWWEPNAERRRSNAGLQQFDSPCDNIDEPIVLRCCQLLQIQIPFEGNSREMNKKIKENSIR